ncbi:protein-glucosylgalactosylhydroxylysine glucosidase-like [Phlebotomus argentipes]|uniref:protein-glucosylgalactosylhydroxylysine glucosidase-like n=1 Tax=Phlebotomus argentipes TaxID=94469 RepID=UPI0028932C37|nr:protein-glucosylgalactosylhydroxylysine glucosidase-like [Phlebotomus argentipes]
MLWCFVFLGLFASVLADNYAFQSNALPSQDVMPTLANGHIGLVVFDHSILVNGLYNGFMGYSHRARIPNHANIQMRSCAKDTKTDADDCLYELNIRHGFFRTVLTGSTFSAEHRVYTHRYFNRLIVNEFRLSRTGGTGAITLDLVQLPGDPSVDFTFSSAQPEDIGGLSFQRIAGQTVAVEDPNYQKELRTVNVFYQTAPDQLILPDGQNEITVGYLTAVDFNEGVARKDLVDAIPQLNVNQIFNTHEQMWETFWQTYGITVVGDDNLASSIHTSLFFLSSSLPSLESNQGNYDFYGLAPAGLGRGGVMLMEYQGHSFWDTEIWMQPPVLMLEPKWSRDLLHYRHITREAAQNHARQTGWKGRRYVWESAYTGREVTPPCCPEVVLYQHHITADIVFAARSHFFATHDMDYLRQEGCQLAVESAEFWESRVVWNEDTETYDIRAVMGPDEDHHNVTNNVYTNVVAGYNLYFSEFASCLCKEVLNLQEYELVEKWSEIARQLTLLHDSEHDYHPQFEGYERGTAIKQADVVLLGFPLQYPMDESTKKNNLHYYSDMTREDGPAMTWSMHVIGHLDIGEDDEAAQNFKRSYDNYIRRPFMVWSEAAEGFVGAGNFITGAGGFLQGIINGYAGVRLHQDSMTVERPRIAPGVTELTINRITYLGSTFSITMQSSQTIFRTTYSNPQIPLSFAINDEEIEGEIPPLTPTDVLVIKPKSYPFGDCQLPSNLIGGAQSLKIASIVLFITTLATLLISK